MKYFKLFNKPELQVFLNPDNKEHNFKLLNPHGLNIQKRMVKEHFILLNEKPFNKCQCSKCKKQA